MAGEPKPYSHVNLLSIVQGDPRPPWDRVPAPVSLDLLIYMEEEPAESDFARRLLTGAH